MDMDVNNYIYDMNKGLAVKKSVKISLDEALGDLTKDRLNKIAALYNISGRSKMNKGSLIDSLHKAITDENNFKINLTTLEENQDNLIKELKNVDSIDSTYMPVNNYLVLYGKGIVFTYIQDDKILMSMPKEVKDTLEKVNNEEICGEKQRYRLVKQYIEAFVNLYGVFEKEELIKTFNEQNEVRLTVKEFKAVLSTFQEQSALVSEYNGKLIHEALLDGEGLDSLIEEVNGKECYKPSKEVLLNYSDEFYMEMTPAHVKFKEYTERICGGNKELAVGLFEDICLSLVDDSLNVEGAIFELERRDIEISNVTSIQEYIGLISEVNNNVRKWAYRGFTANELGLGIDHSQGVTLVKEKVPGRNEPCLCGSGKKYKKCCGK